MNISKNAKKMDSKCNKNRFYLDCTETIIERLQILRNDEI